MCASCTSDDASKTTGTSSIYPEKSREIRDSTAFALNFWILIFFFVHSQHYRSTSNTSGYPEISCQCHSQRRRARHLLLCPKRIRIFASALPMGRRKEKPPAVRTMSQFDCSRKMYDNKFFCRLPTELNKQEKY